MRRIVLCACAGVIGSAHVASAQARSPVIQERVRLDPSQPVDFHVLLVPDTVYVGQQATYEMGVFITESAQQRMRRNPEVVPAELRGVLAYDLGGPQSLPALQGRNQRVFPHVLQRALFPLASGPVVVPASQLSYSLPRTASYFSREEAAVVRADEVSVYVKPLPQQGQPAGFLGAVGVLTVRSRVDAVSARVGEPVVLTVTVGGRGNVKLWPRPNLTASSASLVEAGERVSVDTSGQYVRGAKEFDWLVTPDRAGSLVVPVVDYPYFDPYAEEYRTAFSDSVALSVEGGEVVRDEPTGGSTVLPLRRSDRGEQRAPLSRSPLLWLLVALAPVPAIWRRRSERQARHRVSSDQAAGNVRYPVRDEAVDVARDPARRVAAAGRRAFLEQLASRLDTSVGMLVERTQLYRRLRRRGVTRETTADVLALLDELDDAAWSARGALADPDPAAAHAWTTRRDALHARVDSEAMPSRFESPRSARAPNASHGASRLAILLLTAGLAMAPAVDAGAQPSRTNDAGALPSRANDAGAPPSRFDEAVAAFDDGRFGAAMAAFTELASQAPRNADAWANAGTAAWAAQDTAAAVRAWQRALRLEPTSHELRVRLSGVSSRALQGVAAVPAIPRDLVWLAVVMLWCVGWAVFAWRSAPKATTRVAWLSLRGPRDLAALGCISLAVGGGVWHAVLDAQFSDTALAVVTDRAALRVAPGVDANAVGDAAVGDIVERGSVRTDGARGDVWTAVTLADGRTGWLPERALWPFR